MTNVFNLTQWKIASTNYLGVLHAQRLNKRDKSLDWVRPLYILLDPDYSMGFYVTKQMDR